MNTVSSTLSPLFECGMEKSMWALGNPELKSRQISLDKPQCFQLLNGDMNNLFMAVLNELNETVDVQCLALKGV